MVRHSFHVSAIDPRDVAQRPRFECSSRSNEESCCAWGDRVRPSARVRQRPLRRSEAQKFGASPCSRFGATRGTGLGRYVHLYIVPPMHSLKLCAGRSRIACPIGVEADNAAHSFLCISRSSNIRTSSQSPSADLGRHPRRMSPVFATGAVNTRHPTSWVSRSFRTNPIALSRSPYFARCVAVLPDAETMYRISRTNIVQCRARSVWRALYPRGVHIVSNCA